MPLVKCPDCQHDISDAAPSCIHCGRPMAAPTAPMEVCEVALKRIHGLGLVGGARWLLEAQVMSPQGIQIVGRREYSSDNELANFQGSKKQFHRAKEAITEDLLHAGWEPIDSVSGGSGMSLPRFQRRVGYDRDRLLSTSDPSACGATIRKSGRRIRDTWNVYVDGVGCAKLKMTSLERIDVPPGRHQIQLSFAFLKSELYDVDVQPGIYVDLVCGLTPGLLTNKLVLRRADGGRLSASDNGKPFM